MFVDTRQLSEGSVIRTGVCIIGGGIAGITLAMKLDRQNIDVCLLESGGFRADRATRDLYRGEDLGAWRYPFADGSRSRYLGGSSNCWGGWCRPLDPWDFERRDWIGHSGWPFGWSELAAFYARTHDLLQLGPGTYEPEFWEREIGRRDARRIPLVTGRVRDTISQFSPPARFGKLYREALRRSSRVRVYLRANATHRHRRPGWCRLGRAGRDLERPPRLGGRPPLRARDRRHRARLLLASNRMQPAGLGNSHDLVGRFFMDHPRLLSGRIRFRREWSRNRLSDIKYHYRSAAIAAHGTHVAHQFALTPEVLRQEEILNASVCFSSVFGGEESEAAHALSRIKHSSARGERTQARDFLTALRHPLDAAGYGCARLFRPRWLVRGVKFQLILEPEPHPDSRVTLSPSEKDQLGMNRVRVDWRPTSRVQRTLDRTVSILAEELRRSGVAEVDLDPPVEGQPWPADLEGTWHHMGTTRMHDSPREGVVDRDCRVHGIPNLYVAGSSVFPTCGANFPTITLAALALRLASCLGADMSRPAPSIATGTEPPA